MTIKISGDNTSANPGFKRIETLESKVAALEAE